VQRIPVKIVLDPGTDPGKLLRVGMSVEPVIMVE
jgi:multidrug resistance efflux pump